MSRSERSIQIEAVVLRHSDWGEADRLLTLYTRDMGKLRALAKGVRRLRSRKAGHLEPFTRASLLVARGRDLWIVTQAATVEAYLPMREDLVRTGYAFYIVELIDRFSYEEGENRGLYQLLIDTLARISGEIDPLPAVRYFDIRLLDLLGYRPQLVQCVRCNEAIQAEDQFFSYEMGGVLCPQCGHQTGASRPVSMRALKFMRHYQRSSYEAARITGLPAVVRPELETLLQGYLSYLLEKGLNTPAFLRLVRNGSSGLKG